MVDAPSSAAYECPVTSGHNPAHGLGANEEEGSGAPPRPGGFRPGVQTGKNEAWMPLRQRSASYGDATDTDGRGDGPAGTLAVLSAPQPPLPLPPLPQVSRWPAVAARRGQATIDARGTSEDTLAETAFDDSPLLRPE